MGSDQFCLKWNNYQASMVQSLGSLKLAEELVDVTLCCEGRRIRAHKIILSACSNYFKQIFKDHPGEHPVVILKDVRFCDLENIVKYMYAGQVFVKQDHLGRFLKTAETLEVKGLAQYPFITSGVGDHHGPAVSSSLEDAQDGDQEDPSDWDQDKESSQESGLERDDQPASDGVDDSTDQQQSPVSASSTASLSQAASQSPMHQIMQAAVVPSSIQSLLQPAPPTAQQLLQTAITSQPTMQQLLQSSVTSHPSIQQLLESATTSQAVQQLLQNAGGGLGSVGGISLPQLLAPLAIPPGLIPSSAYHHLSQSYPPNQQQQAVGGLQDLQPAGGGHDNRSPQHGSPTPPPSISPASSSGCSAAGLSPACSSSGSSSSSRISTTLSPPVSTVTPSPLSVVPPVMRQSPIVVGTSMPNDNNGHVMPVSQSIASATTMASQLWLPTMIKIPTPPTPSYNIKQQQQQQLQTQKTSSLLTTQQQQTSTPTLNSLLSLPVASVVLGGSNSLLSAAANSSQSNCNNGLAAQQQQQQAGASLLPPSPSPSPSNLTGLAQYLSHVSQNSVLSTMNPTTVGEPAAASISAVVSGGCPTSVPDSLINMINGGSVGVGPNGMAPQQVLMMGLATNGLQTLPPPAAVTGVASLPGGLPQTLLKKNDVIVGKIMQMTDKAIKKRASTKRSSISMISSGIEAKTSKMDSGAITPSSVLNDEANKDQANGAEKEHLIEDSDGEEEDLVIEENADEEVEGPEDKMSSVGVAQESNGEDHMTANVKHITQQISDKKNKTILGVDLANLDFAAAVARVAAVNKDQLPKFDPTGQKTLLPQILFTASPGPVAPVAGLQAHQPATLAASFPAVATTVNNKSTGDVLTNGGGGTINGFSIQAAAGSSPVAPLIVPEAPTSSAGSDAGGPLQSPDKSDGQAGGDGAANGGPGTTPTHPRNRWRCMQPRVCNYCWKTFSNSFNLKQHIVNVHVQSQGVACHVCEKVVKNKWYLRKHLVTAHGAPLKRAKGNNNNNNNNGSSNGGKSPGLTVGKQHNAGQQQQGRNQQQQQQQQQQMQPQFMKTYQGLVLVDGSGAANVAMMAMNPAAKPQEDVANGEGQAGHDDLEDDGDDERAEESRLFIEEDVRGDDDEDDEEEQINVSD